MAEGLNPYLVLGLDLGIGSCGFCLIDVANHALLEMGSHLFEVPQESKTRTSLAAKRRLARSARRNTKRSRDRLTHCLRLLVRCGLVPKDADKEWLHTRKGDLPTLDLRVRGLDELLDDRQLAQVLYNLASRRGYIPHGESGEGDIDTKKVLLAISDNTERMSELGCRTVGELLKREGRSRNQAGKYSLCVAHSQIVDEARMIFAAQRDLGNLKATLELESDYLTCLSWEKQADDRDTKVYEQVGNCTYFEGERRAARCDLSSELLAAYERLCHITVVGEDGSESKIGKAAVERCMGILFSPAPIRGNRGCTVTYQRIRQILDMPSTRYFKGVDVDVEKKEEPFVPRSWRAMRTAGLPEELLARMLGDRDLADGIGEALAYASTKESLLERLEGLDLSEEEVRHITTLPFGSRNFNGYGARSLKAIKILLDMFEEPEVMTLAQAEEVSGLKELRLGNHRVRTTLLPPYDSYDPSCNNPVVLRSLSRARKVVNAIIRIYGVPHEIHIEVGRSLKLSKREKEKAYKRNRENKSQNERLATIAAGILSCDVSAVRGKVIRKLALHEEQGGFDVYTGRAIDLERLVKDDQYAQIDHVLPYGRTCDDSRRNKVLVLAKSNQDKGNRTPCEWMHSSDDSPDWDEYWNWVMASPKLSYKRQYLLNTSLGEDEEKGFIDRNLNDTRYMSCAIKEWLENTLLFPEADRKVRVLAVSGGATAMLRRSWGLNFGAGNVKDREDERHHAVDAAVIAACSARAVQLAALAHSASRGEARGSHESRLSSSQPWPSFADEVIAHRSFVVPTRMVSHKVTGRAFQDMAYGLEGVDEDNGHKFVIRREGKLSKTGNAVVDKAGSVRIVDQMAFIRFWLDPEGRPARGKHTGVWYVEPVYYADIPAIVSGSYIPLAIKGGVARMAWDPVPSSALASRPVTVFPGDVLVVDGMRARWQGINIGNRHLELEDLVTGAEVKGFPSIGSWDNTTSVVVLDEDCLGHCHKEWASGRQSEK